MQSKTKDFIVKLEAIDALNSYPRSFELYEEYSQKNINETFKTCRENFEKADFTTRKELEEETEREVENFCYWLEENKNFDHSVAYYCSTSLKGLLLGLPVGVQIAQLFGVVLDTQAKE